jgi:hypothetical protein
MTDLLDRPAAAEGLPEVVPDVPRRPERARRTQSGRPQVVPAHWMIAAALLGASAIHFAMTPSHFGESGIEGAGFLVSAWVQAALAAAVLWRPTRAVLLGTAGSSLALIAAWVVSRTVGLPVGAHSGHAESVTLVDGVCVALEAASVLLAVGLLLGLARRVARGRGLAIVGVAAALVATTGAVASPSARDHAAHSHGEAAGEAGAAGHTHGGLPAGDDKGFSLLHNGHQHSHASDKPLTARERVLLARQLAATTPLIARYPTLGAAESAGWKRAGPFSPGLGTHYQAPGGIDFSVPGTDLRAPMLIFDGIGKNAPLAGFMFLSYGSKTAPQGFAGPNDNWHYHSKVCITINAKGEIDTPYGADNDAVTNEMCAGVHGQMIQYTGYMVHVWNVPGYESPDGMFTELNPKITCPDGTYYTVPLKAKIGYRKTVCRNA